MSRAIDADALKDMLQNLAYDDWNQGVTTSWADAYLECADMVEEMPTIEPEQRWIPVSERLPETWGDYLTTLTDKDGTYVDVTEWQTIIGGRWVAPIDECDYCEIGNVTAWMPLPEPYKGE